VIVEWLPDEYGDGPVVRVTERGEVLAEAYAEEVAATIELAASASRADRDAAVIDFLMNLGPRP